MLDKHLLLQDGKPAAWAADVESMIVYIEEHMTDEDFFLPAELRGSSDPAAVMAGFKSLLEEYGKLLETWPEIHRAARSINAER